MGSHKIPRGEAQLVPPRLVARVWGGGRLSSLIGAKAQDATTREARAKEHERIGEAWFGETETGSNLPLAKLLDVCDRLSVQVHPDNALARELHGVGEIGKHEAWVILEAAPDATILLGRDPGITESQLAASLQAGDAIESLLARVPVAAGDVIDVPPGLLHALMPPLFVWELQQPSDRTYRVSDWGRIDANRPLHRSEALRATNTAATAGRRARLPESPGRHELLDSGPLCIAAVVGPWSGSMTTTFGDLATLVAFPSQSREGSKAVAHAAIGGCSLVPYASARLGGGTTAVSVSAGGALLLGALEAKSE